MLIAWSYVQQKRVCSVSCLFLGCLCLSGQEVNAAQVSFEVAVRGFLYITCRWGSTLIFSIYLYISSIYIGGL